MSSTIFKENVGRLVNKDVCQPIFAIAKYTGSNLMPEIDYITL